MRPLEKMCISKKVSSSVSSALMLKDPEHPTPFFRVLLYTSVEWENNVCSVSFPKADESH